MKPKLRYLFIAAWVFLFLHGFANERPNRMYEKRIAKQFSIIRQKTATVNALNQIIGDQIEALEGQKEENKGLLKFNEQLLMREGK